MEGVGEVEIEIKNGGIEVEIEIEIELRGLTDTADPLGDLRQNRLREQVLRHRFDALLRRGAKVVAKIGPQVVGHQAPALGHQVGIVLHRQLDVGDAQLRLLRLLGADEGAVGEGPSESCFGELGLPKAGGEGGHFGGIGPLLEVGPRDKRLLGNLVEATAAPVHLPKCLLLPQLHQRADLLVVNVVEGGLLKKRREFVVVLVLVRLF